MSSEIERFLLKFYNFECLSPRFVLTEKSDMNLKWTWRWRCKVRKLVKYDFVPLLFWAPKFKKGLRWLMMHEVWKNSLDQKPQELQSSKHFHRALRIAQHSELRGRKVRIFSKLSGYHARVRTHTSQRGVCSVIRLIDALTQLIKSWVLELGAP